MQAQAALKLICRKTLKPFYPYEEEDGKVRCSECHEVVYKTAQAGGRPPSLPVVPP